MILASVRLPPKKRRTDDSELALHRLAGPHKAVTSVAASSEGHRRGYSELKGRRFSPEQVLYAKRGRKKLISGQNANPMRRVKPFFNSLSMEGRLRFF